MMLCSAALCGQYQSYRRTHLRQDITSFREDSLELVSNTKSRTKKFSSDRVEDVEDVIRDQKFLRGYPLGVQRYRRSSLPRKYWLDTIRHDL